MVVSMRSQAAFVFFGVLLLVLLQFSHGQGMTPSPAPRGPVSDGNAIDQGIAYILLFVALAVTYLVH